MVQGLGSNEVMFWNDKDGGCGGFSASAGEFQNPVLNPELDAFSGFQSSDFKRIRLSSEFNQQEGGVNYSEETTPLGLTLSKTPSFLNLVEMKLSQARSTSCSIDRKHQASVRDSCRIDRKHQASVRDSCRAKMDAFLSQPMSEKLKASNFPALYLKIGSWERISRYEGDLIAKCYYAKRKIVWEVLEGALKSKIEIPWTDIEAIRAIIHDDEPGILEIELNQPPLFFRETNPQPRKHTLWQQASDFTGGQAPLFRRHCVKFPPGTLDKHYEKLLQCDNRLLELSQRPFPRLESPYFYPNIYGVDNISFDFIAYQSQAPPGLQHPVPPHPDQNFKLTIGKPFGIVDSDSPMSATTQANAAFACQAYCELAYGAAAAAAGGAAEGLPDSNTGMLSVIENHLLSDSQNVCSDERKVLAKVRSMCSLLNPKNNIGMNELEYKHENFSADHSVVLGTTEHFEVDGRVIYPQPICCLPPLDSDENLVMHNYSSYPYEFSHPKVNEYAAVDAGHEVHLWR